MKAGRPVRLRRRYYGAARQSASARSLAAPAGTWEASRSVRQASCVALRIAAGSVLWAWSQSFSSLAFALAESEDADCTLCLQLACACATWAGVSGGGFVDVWVLVVVDVELLLPHPAASAPPASATTSNVNSFCIIDPLGLERTLARRPPSRSAII